MKHRPPRIAVCQQAMAWTTAENLSSILAALDVAAAHGADICVFPELAVTGFHRRIREEATRERVAPAMDAVRARCQRLGVAAALGVPLFRDNGDIVNGVAFIDRQGRTVGTVEKVGITPAESTFFARGESRLIVAIDEMKTSAIVCREVLDYEDILHTLRSHELDFLLWPGIMRPDPDRPDRAEHYLDDAAGIARQLKTYLVQSNWPNSLNYPAEGAEQGHSVVFDPNGRLMFRLPKSQAGVAVFNLAEATFTWIKAGMHAS